MECGAYAHSYVGRPMGRLIVIYRITPIHPPLRTRPFLTDGRLAPCNTVMTLGLCLQAQTRRSRLWPPRNQRFAISGGLGKDAIL